MKTYTIVVLNDGKTYSAISGCQILTVTEEAINALDGPWPATIRDLERDPRKPILSHI